MCCRLWRGPPRIEVAAHSQTTIQMFGCLTLRMSDCL